MAASQKSHAPGIFPKGNMAVFVLVTVLFFLWGMSNNLTDILVQQFQKSFELTQMQAQLVQTSVFFGYFCMALPAAFLMERRGYKAGILGGLFLFGTGMLMFWPAAVVGKYWTFLTALFFVGCGSAVLETAANPFIAQFGPSETSVQRLNFSQAFNPPGTITGVILGATFIFSGIELKPAQVAAMKLQGTYQSYLHSEIMRVVPVYLGLGCVVFFLAFLIWRVRFPAIDQSVEAAGGEAAMFSDLLHAPRLWWSVAAQFCYCGAQISTWSSLIPYLRQYTTLTEKKAAYWLIGNLIAFSVGRFAATALMRWIRPMRLVLAYAVINLCLLSVCITHPSLVGAGAILATSFFMAPMFPSIFAVGVSDLGPAAKLGGSTIVMAVVGGAIIPPLLGYVAHRYSSYALGYSVTAVCYLFVVLYAWMMAKSIPVAEQAATAQPATGITH
ncbi:L-fucose:H+ symporter permease [Terriglobus sp. 2YAB30_2]|uniref:L-fucose:H+ symporter permease n=1 Tax=unclassified Terriglobus TaxID=2628988 RepID=UPI003F97B18C